MYLIYHDENRNMLAKETVVMVIKNIAIGKDGMKKNILPATGVK